MKFSFKNFLFFIFLVGATFADVYKEYNPTYAVAYANNNYRRTYNYTYTGGGSNPFFNWATYGNCTNFVSQCLIGGFIHSNSAVSVWNARYDFDCDATGVTSYRWYFHTATVGERGEAFLGANDLYKYVKGNAPSYKGLHFGFVTQDYSNSYLDADLVEVGDVVFVDWTNNSTPTVPSIDHAMIVVEIDNGQSGYAKIKVAHQSYGDAPIGSIDRLSYINHKSNYKAIFYVYRPEDYNPNGL